MTALSQAVEALLLLVGGLLVRAGLVILVLAVIASVVLAGLAAWRQLVAVYDRARGIRTVEGARWRAGLLYTQEHTWLRRLAGGRVTMGLDDLAQRIFVGEPRIALPEPGLRVEKGDPLVEIAVDGRTARIAAPVRGTVLAVNDRLRGHAGWIHDDPYGRGWLVKMDDAEGKPVEAREGKSALGWLASELHRLERHLEWQLGMAAADGGEPVMPPVRILEDAQWQGLVDSFLTPAPAAPRDTWGA